MQGLPIFLSEMKTVCECILGTILVQVYYDLIIYL